MATVTYYSLFSSGVTVFTGFVTNTGSQCSSPAVYPARAQLSTVNSLCASSPRYQATGTMTDMMSFAVGGFTAATVVSGASWQIYIRKPSTKQFWLEAYNAAGVKQAGGLGPVSVTGSSIMANVTFPGSLTVPAGGFLVVRCGFTGASNRFYFGTNPKGNGLPSAVLTTTQLPAGVGATITGVAATSGVGNVAPQLSTLTHQFKDSTGTSTWGAGVKVNAILASDMATGTLNVIASGTTDATGTVTLGFSQPAGTSVVLIPDHLDPNAPLGEQAITEALLTV